MSKHAPFPHAARLRSIQGMTRARAVAVLSAVLVGCGGGVDGPASVSASVVNEAEGLPLLIASDGRVNPSMTQALPVDPGARTRSAHYTLQAQARQLELDHPGEVTWLHLSPGDAVEMAVGVAHGIRAAMNYAQMRRSSFPAAICDRLRRL